MVFFVWGELLELFVEQSGLYSGGLGYKGLVRAGWLWQGLGVGAVLGGISEGGGQGSRS